MSMTAADIKLTKLQIEVLQALKDGQLLTIDKLNMPWLGERALQPQTRYFLTEKRLVTRKDPERSIEAQGNGFTISKKGLETLAAQRSKG
jgi:hypothetical protein